MNMTQACLPTVAPPIASNLFMTFALYGHLKRQTQQPWILGARVSRGIALFEYLLQVPANRIRFAGGLTLAQLKITQEVVRLAVFAPFAVLDMNQPVKTGFLWVAWCMAGAVYFIFRG
jgi:uncharacterized protein (DUF486 family)